jgi:pyruvate formate lyase activating enzyme
MRFGGLQKNSLIDFPGRIAALLFTQGCNFHCPYCHNPSLIPMAGSQDFSEEEILLFLEKRQGLIEGVAITGGEPTLHNDLISFCRKVKALCYPVKLDTNGSRPEMLRRLLSENLVDFIAMDIKTDPENYTPLLSGLSVAEALVKSIRLILESGLDHEFRSTCVAPFISEERILRILPLIRGAQRYALQHFSQATLLDSQFFLEKGRGLNPDEMEKLREVIAPHVGCCDIR